MKRADKKRYLNKARTLHFAFQLKLERYQELEVKAMKVTPSNDGMPKAAGGKSGNQIWAMYADAGREIESILDEQKEYAEAIKTIGDPLLEEIMTAYYIDGAGWSDIAEGMKVSYRTISRWHNAAIDRIVISKE